MNFIKNYFSNARVGDEVTDIVKGECGIISSIYLDSNYPIEVEYGGRKVLYTINGKMWENDRFQRLFYKGYEPEIKIPEPPKKKFELEYDWEKYFVDFNMSYKIRVPGEIAKKYGRCRKTKKAAKQALKLQTRAMRLHALAEQLDGLIEWSEKDGGWIVRFDPCGEEGEKWDYTYTDKFHPEKVYMTKECAEKICEMLNNGEFDLEV